MDPYQYFDMNNARKVFMNDLMTSFNEAASRINNLRTFDTNGKEIITLEPGQIREIKEE